MVTITAGEYSNGDVYKGQWVADKKHGKGVMTYANKDVFDNEWIESTKWGQGVMKYHNGDVYSGEWSADKHHGKGTFDYADGYMLKSVGKWKKGKKVGLFEDIVRIRKQVYYVDSDDDGHEVKSNSNRKRESTSDKDTDTDDELFVKHRKGARVCLSPQGCSKVTYRKH